MCVLQSVARKPLGGHPPSDQVTTWLHDPYRCRCQADRLRLEMYRAQLEVGDQEGAVEARPEERSDAAAVDLVELCSNAQHSSIARVCRRRNGRTPALILTPQIRDALRKGETSALRCGTRFKAWRRRVDQGGAWTEQRLVAPVLCGCRQHRSCDLKIRERQKMRMEGPYTQFWTMTYPHGERDLLADAQAIHGWIRQLTEAVRAHLDVKGQDDIRVSAQGKREWRYERKRRKKGHRKHSLFQYAWVIEAHKSGYPHVHIVTNTVWCNFQWLSETWDRITGSVGSHPQVDEVWQRGGLSHYLTTYVSKGGINSDLLAVWRRRRLWATTRKKKKVDRVKWTAEKARPPETLVRETRTAKRWAYRNGWKLMASNPGVYALWQRAVGDGARSEVWWENGERLEGCVYFEEYEKVFEIKRRPFKATGSRAAPDWAAPPMGPVRPDTLTPSVKVC